MATRSVINAGRRLVLVTTVAILLSVIPADALASLPNVCLVKRLSGHDCLGCGMTRALAALTRGEWSMAFALNRGVGVVALLVTALAMHDARVVAKERQ